MIVPVSGRSMIRNLSDAATLVTSASIEVICESCFSFCGRLQSVTFESRSKLQRIEARAFAWSGLKGLVIRTSVEVISKSCFSDCSSLESITLESGSKLHMIGASAFSK
jgi:hypothetical protein